MSTERPSARNGVQRCRWVCLLLALSFLYNPFSAVAATAGGLNVRHSASYRATVAASELQQLAPMGEKQIHLVFDLFVVNDVLVLPELHLRAAIFPARELPPPQNHFVSNLWFRPPPAL